MDRRLGPRWLGRGAPAALLLAVEVVVAWVAATPPATGPDEIPHDVKALGAGRGQLLGRPARFSLAERRELALSRVG